jgi:hypothetical protein
MELDVSHTPAATVGINSCVCVGDRVWVNMGTKEGVRGQNSSDQYWAKVVVGLNPNTEKVGVHREGIGYRVRQVPVLACSVDPASGDTSASSVGPNPNARPSMRYMGKQQKERLEKVAGAKWENELRRLHIEVDKLRAANLKSTDAAANEMALALKQLERKKGTPPPPSLSLSCLYIIYIVCVCI